MADDLLAGIFGPQANDPLHDLFGPEAAAKQDPAWTKGPLDEDAVTHDLKSASTDPEGARRLQVEERSRATVARSRKDREQEAQLDQAKQLAGGGGAFATADAARPEEHPVDDLTGGFGTGWDATLAMMRQNRADFGITVHGPTKELLDASTKAKAEADAINAQQPDGEIAQVGYNIGNLAASMFSSGKQAVKAAGVGAAVGATAGAAAGAPVGGVGAIPGALGGAVAGGVAGLTGGFVSDSYVTNAGQIMGDLREAGVDPSLAKRYGMAGGAIMAGLDLFGIGFAARPFVKAAERKAVQGIIADELKKSALSEAGKDYLIGVAGETAAETTQQIVQDVATDLAKQAQSPDFKTIFNDPERRHQVVRNAVQTAVATAEGMAVLGVPGAALTGIREHRQNADMERGAPLVTPEDQASPLPTDLIQQGKGAFENALREAQDKPLEEIGGPLPNEQPGGIAPEAPILAPQPQIPAINEAGAPPVMGRDTLKAHMRQIESGGNDQARSTTSSAAGRYGFLDSTWAALGGDPNKRLDPDEQERMMDKLLNQNEHALSKAGVQATAGNLYLAHFLGAGGAIHALENPNAKVDAKVQEANPFAEGWTNAQLAAWANRKMGGKPGEYTSNPNRAADQAWAEKDRDADREEMTFPTIEHKSDELLKAADKPFDSEAFDKERNDRITASKAEGNKHLDDLEPAVETMRGKPIYYAHDPKVTGTVRTVANTGEVVVHWNDKYSADKELATERTEGKKTVHESWLGPNDLKDYVVGTPQSALKSTEAQATPEHVAFAPETGTLGIPRAEMPQIKAEHRGAMVNFLNARGIEHQEETVPASSLKPTQAEYIPAKVEKALGFEGGDRAILVSQDNHIVDGQHQALAAEQKGEDVRIIRLNAPIRKVLAEALNFPSSSLEEGAAAAQPTQPESVSQLPSVAPSDNNRPAARPSDFLSVVKDHLAHQTKRTGLRVRISAEDAISQGVPAESIFINAKAKHPVVKLRLQGVFATAKGPLKSKAQPTKIISLDALHDFDPERFGRQPNPEEHYTRLSQEDAGDLLRLSLERHDDALDRHDDRYEPYAAEMQQANADPDGEHIHRIDEIAREHGIRLETADVHEALHHVHAGESHRYAVEAAVREQAARSLAELAETSGNDAYLEHLDDLYQGEVAEQRGEGAPEGGAGPEGAAGGEAAGNAGGEQPEEAPQAQEPASDVAPPSEDVLAPRPTDTRDHLQRKADERLKPEKEQKPVGSDGGLFDTQDTTGDLFDPVAKAKAALTDALAALEGQKEPAPKPTPQATPQERGLEPLFDEDNPEKQIGFFDPKTGKVERELKDAGEKIGGARKDQWAQRGLTLDDLEGMNQGEAHQFVVKDQVWPKPDYAKLVEDGVPANVAAGVKLIRDSLAAKPKIDSEEARRDYIEAMQAARSVLDGVKTEDDLRGIQQKLYDKLGVQSSSYGYYDRNDEGQKAARRKLFSIFKGRTASFRLAYKDERKIRELVAAGWPEKGIEPWTRRFKVRESYNRSEEGTWVVADKKGKTLERSLPSKEAAEAKAKELYEGLNKNPDGTKKAPVRPHLDSLARTGKDVREGRDISPDDFLSDFGFRGVEFGNWVANDERQKAINLAFEAMYDLADTLGVPADTLSLGGQLALAFGARGSGQFAAHYEPGKLVINLTKLSGAGSLAHEWGHAVDHYFGKINAGDSTRGAPTGVTGWDKSYSFKALGNLRPDLAAAFDRVMDALFSKDKTRAETVRDLELKVEQIQAAIARQEERVAAAPKGNHPSNRKFLKDSAEFIGYQKTRLKAFGDMLAEARDEAKPLKPEKIESSYYREAQKLSGKSGKSGYWSRPTELFARAFESFVFDRIKERGNVSQYLVQGVEGDRYEGEQYKGNPYPAGEERDKIDAAFANLFDTIEVKGIPAPREGGPTQALGSVAEDNAAPFYSALERAVEANPTKRAPAAQWKATLARAPGVKQEELEWSGLTDWLDMQEGPVDREALLGVVRDGGISVDEVVLGRPDEEKLADYGLTVQDLEEGENEDAPLIVEDQKTQFDNWTSDPSNPSYRELLITLPLGERGNPARAPATHWDQEAVVAHARFMDKTDADGKRVLFIEEVQSDWHQKGRDQGYETKVDPETVKVAEAKAKAADKLLRDAKNKAGRLLLPIIRKAEEFVIKAGADAGFNAQDKALARRRLEEYDRLEPWQAYPILKDAATHMALPEEVDAAISAATDAREAANLAGRELDVAKGLITSGGVPNAPFKSTWPALVMKRMIVWGVRNGYDRVAWTTGDEQESRYWGEPSAEQRNFAEVTEPPRVREELFEVLGPELASVLPLEIVDPAMLPALKNDKVREAVIKAIPVDVVDVLAKHGLTTKELVSDPQMVGDALPVVSRAPVARGFADALQLVGTRLRAALDRVPSFETARGDRELFSAIRASDLDPSVIVRLLTTPAKDGAEGSAAAGKAEASAGTEAGRLARVGAEGRSAALASALNWHGRAVADRPGDRNEVRYAVPPGEGMRAFYDRNLVNITNDIIKKYGAKVGPVDLGSNSTRETFSESTLRGNLEQAREEIQTARPDSIRRSFLEDVIADGERRLAAVEAGKYNNSGFEITDKMREAASSGFPLFQMGGAGVNMTGEQKTELRKVLLEELKQYGIDDRISLNVVNALENAKFQGQYWDRVISVAANKARDPSHVLAHETIHAMKALGLFTKDEWSHFTAKAWKSDAIRAWVERNYPHGDEAYQKEEAAAEWFAHYTDLKKKDDFTTRAGIRIAAFWRALRRALARVLGKQWTHAIDTAEQIRSGKFGARPTGFGDRAERPMTVTFGKKEPKHSADDAFFKWFGDSKVVDENGAPLVVYHATSASFQSFALSKSKGGFYFTPDKLNAGPGRKVVSAYIALRRPLETTDRRSVQHMTQDRREHLQSQGHDGAIWRDAGGKVLEVVAFEPTQIKSTDNRGTFDPTNPDIRASVAPSILDSKPERMVAPIRAIIGADKAEALAEGLDDFRTAVQDRMLPMLRAQTAIERMLGRELSDEENPYIGEELYHGRVGARLQELTDQHVEPLFDAMRVDKITPEELETYLYARHAPERNARISKINPEFAEGTGSGMTDEEAAAIMDAVDESGKREALDRLAAKVDALNEWALQTRIDYGLLSKAEADAWRQTFQHYVPLRGLPGDDMADDYGGRLNRQSGFSVKGKESRRSFGRKSKAGDIIAYSLLQAEEAIVRGEQNRVAKETYDLAKAAPDAEFWRIDKIRRVPVLNKASGLVTYRAESRIAAEDAPYTVSVKIEGDEHRITFNRQNPAAKRAAAAMRNLSTNQFEWWVKNVGWLNRWLSKVNTQLSPEFIVTNAFRDIQTASINLAGVDVKGIESGVLKDYPAALVAATKGAFGKGSGDWAKWFREFKMEGGQTAFNETPTIDQLRAKVQKAAKVANSRFGAKQMLKAGVQVIEHSNDGVENALRLATYKNARERGLSPKKAASLAKNVTVNFNRKGTYGPLLNTAYLFFNASVQGNARILTAMKSKKVRRIIYGTVIAGFALQFLNGAWSGTDDDGEKYYDKIPEYEKQRNLIVMLGGSTYIKLPMPWGYNVFPNLGRMAARIYQGERPMTAIWDWGSGVFDAFNPVGGAQSLLSLLSPTITDPIVDLEQNRDYAGKPIMPDERQFGPQVPNSQRYWNSVPPYDKAITDFLNEATGGDDVRPGTIDISPEALDYLQQTTFGAAGNLARNIVSLGSKALSDDPTEVIERAEIPFARKVIGGKPGWYDKAAFYARLGQIEQDVAYAKQYIKAGDREGLNKLILDDRDVLELEKAAKQARKQMRGTTKAKNELDYAVEKGEIDDSEAKRIRAAIDADQKNTIATFNAIYLQHIKQPLRP